MKRPYPICSIFYSAISAISNNPFDVNRAAELELEWWIVHREREKHSPEELPKLLAETSAVMYHMPYEPLLEHGKLRAAAMRIRDGRLPREE